MQETSRTNRGKEQIAGYRDGFLFNIRFQDPGFMSVTVASQNYESTLASMQLQKRYFWCLFTWPRRAATTPPTGTCAAGSVFLCLLAIFLGEVGCGGITCFCMARTLNAQSRLKIGAPSAHWSAWPGSWWIRMRPISTIQSLPAETGAD